MRRLAEDADRMQPRMRARVTELQEALVAETAARGAADAGNLRVIAASMGRLQREALVNFGTEDIVAEHEAAAAADAAEAAGAGGAYGGAGGP